MIKAVIVEDNFVALNILKRMLENNFSDIEIVGEASNVNEAVSLIKDLLPDLLFLDIELPDGNAFNILDYVEEQNFKIIFVTSHENYAIKAIKLSALDYLVKPVSKKDLIDAVEKFKKEFNYQNSDIIARNTFKEILKNKNLNPSKLVLSTNKEHLVVEIKDIVRCQSDSYYTNVFLNSNERIFVSKTLKEYETLLSDYGFIRVHHSHLVNVNYIKSFNSEDNGHLILKDGSYIPVSRRKKSAFMEMFKDKNFL